MSELSYQEVVEQIKGRLDIIDVVSQFVILKKSGNTYWGLCPFHKEKTPSFSVTPRLQIFKCFGCGEGGDVFSFLMKIHNQTFPEMIKEQADKLGIELPNSYGNSTDIKSKKQSMIEIMQKSADFYNSILLEDENAKEALNYLEKRGITKEIINEYKLGFSLNSQDSLQAKLEDKYDKSLLEEAGLVIKRTNQVGYLDRFRNRIMIPIQDESGIIVAFGARALNPEQNPKYLNSPDSLLYNKSKILYGVYQAKEAIKEKDAVIIMEGYFDVISPQSNGLKNCVASCGTSLTPDHIKLISRYTQSRRIFLAFDTDSAGKKATDRGADLIFEAFEGLGNIKQFDEVQNSLSNDKYACEIRVISPPEGKDPDEYIRENGINAYLEHVNNAPLFLDFQINEILKEISVDFTPQKKLKLLKKLVPIVSGIDNIISRKEYIKMISEKLDISEIALSKEISNVNLPEKFIITQDEPIVTKSENISQKTQKNLLSLYLINESNLNINNLKEKLKEIEFDDEKLNKIKTTIDKLTFQVNNVLDLTQELYTQFAEDNDYKEVLTDLIYMSESFKGLSDKDYAVLINESISKLNLIKTKTIKNNLKNKYKKAENDEIKAKEYQILLRDQIKNKYKIGDIK